MNHLVSILQQPISQSNQEQAMEDYINMIQTEGLKGGGTSDLDDDALMAFREKKSWRNQNE